MPIYEEAYSPWAGRPLPRAVRIWTIAQDGIRIATANLWIRWILILLLLGAGAIAFLWFIFIQLPRAVDIGRVLPQYMSTNAYRTFLADQAPMFVFALIATFAGAGLISRDVRSQAVPLYLSRPITKLDYIAGKFAALVLFLTAATLFPGILVWAAAAGIGIEEIGWGTRLKDLGGIFATATVIAVPMAAAVLAFSSLSRRGGLAGVYWILFYVCTAQLQEALVSSTEEAWYELLAWHTSVYTLSGLFFEERIPLNAPVKPFGPWEAFLILAALTAAGFAVVAWRLRRIEEA